MTLDPLRVKNSQTAARAVLNIMAHYGIPPLSYKAKTFAAFLLLALRVFTESRNPALRMEERACDIFRELQNSPPLKPVGQMLERALQKSELTVGVRSWTQVTVADLLFLSPGRGYRYTKIVGSQEFKSRIDEALVRDLQAMRAVVGVSASSLSMLLAHMVKLDLYAHFYLNAPATIDALPELSLFSKDSLYLALKSFMMAKKDFFDPELAYLPDLLDNASLHTLQRFFQTHGIYRFSDWFPQASRFLTDQFGAVLSAAPEVRPADISLEDPEEVWHHLRSWLTYTMENVDA